MTIKNQAIFQEKNKIFTENLCIGKKVYDEKIVKIKGKEFRAWNPYRSKLAAALLKGLEIDIKPDSKVLYLGAATGTTVSHISDILKNGVVYSVEVSPIAIKSLIRLSNIRKNIIPILEDAFHSERYSHILSSVDIVYQDISQRNQSEIFIENINRYLKESGIGILMVKARSIDVSLKPQQAYELVCSKLEKNSLKVVKKIDLNPYQKDHAALIVSL